MLPTFFISFDPDVLALSTDLASGLLILIYSIYEILVSQRKELTEWDSRCFKGGV